MRRIRVRISYPLILLNNALTRLDNRNKAFKDLIILISIYRGIRSIRDLLEILNEIEKFSFKSKMETHRFIRRYLAWDLRMRFIRLEDLHNLNDVKRELLKLHNKLKEEWYSTRLPRLIKIKIKKEEEYNSKKLLDKVERLYEAYIPEGIVAYIIDNRIEEHYVFPNKIAIPCNINDEDLLKLIGRIALERKKIIRRSLVIDKTLLHIIEQYIDKLWQESSTRNFINETFHYVKDKIYIKGPRKFLRIVLHEIFIKKLLDDYLKGKMEEDVINYFDTSNITTNINEVVRKMMTYSKKES